MYISQLRSTFPWDLAISVRGESALKGYSRDWL